MRQTIRTCDCCKQVVPDANQFWHIGIALQENTTYFSPGYANSIRQQVDWCRTCVDRFALIPTSVPSPAEPAPSPSEVLEAAIREIVRDEASQA